MFESLLKRLDSISIDDREADQLFFIDLTGRPVSLREYLEDWRGTDEVLMSKLSASAHPAHGPDRNRKSLLEDPEIRELVDQYINSIPEEEELAIIGEGTFSAERLKEEVENRTLVGERLAHLVVDDHMFLEEAARQGKIRINNKERWPR